MPAAVNRFRRLSPARALMAVGLPAAILGALLLWAGSGQAAAPGAPVGSEAVALGTLHGDGYVVTVHDASGAVGESTSIVVVIEATGTYKVNARYPHKVRLEQPPEGLDLPRRTLKRDDGRLDDPQRFTFRIPARATRAGSFPVAGQLKFSVCDASCCLIKKTPLQATVTAK